ncbi:MAG: thioredoxin domain-containing protein [Candidatus Lokiarchaeota archaeon]|nr:thioredoxin domain-containing protein [Candidatus Lokiarchaeota archaeon]
MNRTANHLAGESSPYLKQHMYNLVDWYPWGELAFLKAKEEDKPVFLSIGYSTCHWCHVMAHESFEDEKTAQYLNDYFISIKLDREERPDLDQIYQHVIQMMGGRGGWPLTIFMTHGKKPFFAGTYFPNVRKFGMRSFTEILQEIVKLYQTRRHDIEHTGNQVLDTLTKISRPTSPDNDEITHNILERAMESLASSFDSTFGGFGTAPKFPNFTSLLFIIRQIAEFEKTQPNKYEIIKEELENTLDHIANGGIYDHVEGGFARYSVDQQWIIPHFEKMLYDNALAIQVYSEAYYVFQKARYKEVVRETINWVINHMYSEGNGFYSALDADSEGEEGKYYVWKKTELEKIIPTEMQKLFFQAYGVTEIGNFEHNTNHLYISDEELVEKYKNEFTQILKSLHSIREKRIPPSLDLKILTAWTSLMISSFYSAYRILNDPKIRIIAHMIVESISQRLYSPKEQILYRVLDPESGIRKTIGHLDDYAYFIQALLVDFQYYPNRATYSLIRNLIEIVETQFADRENQGYFFSSKLNTDVSIRMKLGSDMPLPSPNAVMAENLLQLYYYTGEETLLHKAEFALLSFIDQAHTHPTGYGAVLLSLQWYLYGSIDIVILDKSKSVEHMITFIHTFYTPRLHLWYQEKVLPELRALLEKFSFNDKYSLYLCKNFQCFTPTDDWSAFINLMKRNLIELSENLSFIN